MGRPKLTNPRAVRVLIRGQADEIRAWKLAAKRAGLTLSAWLRGLANAASGYSPKDGE